MILKARAVLTMTEPPIENGAVEIEGNVIKAVGHADEMRAGEILDLGDVVLMPGLINAHCHLDYSMMRGAIQPQKTFTAWVQRINALKRSLDTADYLAAIEHGFAECIHWGTTTVCNIESFPELMPHLPEPPIRTWWFYEMIDVRHRITTEEVVAGALSFFQHRGNTRANFGLSPHAPFTASERLYRLANDCSQAFAMPLTTHLAESREEFEMFRYARGALFDFMTGIGRPMTDCGRLTPFQTLWEEGLINHRWLLVHMNELAEEDLAALGEVPRGSAPHLVHCPGSHRYFGHARFPFRRLHEMGVTLCVGTDSLASTDSLSLLQELRRLREIDGWLTPEESLRTVTTNPARALGQSHQLGKIAPGAWADLIALPFSGNIAAIHEEIVEFNRPIPWMMIDGKIRT
ncbi:MAG: amidohydrolase family protein [Chthoniobacteraceae bacterium]